MVSARNTHILRKIVSPEQKNILYDMYEVRTWIIKLLSCPVCDINLIKLMIIECSSCRNFVWVLGKNFLNTFALELLMMYFVKSLFFCCSTNMKFRFPAKYFDK